MAPKRSPEGPHPAYCGMQQEREMTAEESPTVGNCLVMFLCFIPFEIKHLLIKIF